MYHLPFPVLSLFHLYHILKVPEPMRHKSLKNERRQKQRPMTILGNTKKDKIWRQKTGGLGWLPLLLSTQKVGMVVGMEELSGKEIFFTFSFLDLSVKQEEVRFNNEI